jgi:hypothetical protein
MERRSKKNLAFQRLESNRYFINSSQSNQQHLNERFTFKCPKAIANLQFANSLHVCLLLLKGQDLPLLTHLPGSHMASFWQDFTAILVLGKGTFVNFQSFSLQYRNYRERLVS